MAGPGSDEVRDMDNEEFECYLKNCFAHLPKPKNSHSINRETDYDSNDYNFDYPSRGLALILSNEKFRAPDERLTGLRLGNSIDESKLSQSFTCLGFDVIVLKDLTASQMQLASKRASTLYNHEDADCLVCAVLSHGGEHYHEADIDGIHVVDHHLLGVDKAAAATKDIISSFDDENCLALKDKPRLFFIQACRGKALDDGIESLVKKDPASLGGDGSPGSQSAGFDVTDAKPGDYNPNENIDVRSIPLYQDCLIMYATPPGYFAWRNETNGSPFVEALSKFLQHEEVGGKSFCLGLQQVCGVVAERYETNTRKAESCNKKQMPIVDSMLIKDIYMKKKKPMIPIHA